MTQFDIISTLASILVFLSPFLLKKYQTRNEIAATAATLGVLGTFIGIFYGLITFDVSNIDGSVPQLLEGLKTAFLTSIAGMLAGIIVKVKPKFYGIEVVDDGSELSIAESMLQTLKDIDENQKEISKRESEQLRKIELALCGDGDTTLLTQIQKLRTTISDKQDDLIKEFRTFAEKMAENNSKALIDALTEVMRDFNTKINEQFGENFKKLNEAVEKILVWQENYKEQVEKMVKQLGETVKVIETTALSISEMEEDFAKISNTSDHLKDLIVIFTSEIETINEIADSAKNAFPIIEDNITKLTEEFSNKVISASNELEKGTKAQQEGVENQIKIVNETNANLNEKVKEVLTTLNGQIESLMKQNSERIAKQVSELDKALQEELTKSLTTLANQLGSLSNKFAQDYSPITDKLKEILDSFDGNRQ